MNKIDLGVDQSERFKDMAVSAPPMPEKRVDYPRFHYSGPKELELPTEGEMTIQFKKTSETSMVRDDGSHWYECDIEVRCIHGVEGEDEEDESPTHRYNGTEEALDALVEQLRKAKES